MKNLGVLSSKLFFLIVAPLKEAKEGVRSYICLALKVIDPKMVSRKLLGPLNLMKAQILCIYELTKVVIVG